MEKEQEECADCKHVRIFHINDGECMVKDCKCKRFVKQLTFDEFEGFI
jgi:hypothetical protein